MMLTAKTRRSRRFAAFLRVLCALCGYVLLVGSAGRAQNFTVSGGGAFNETVRQAAEQQRRELALYWLGQELPNWAEPCPIILQVGEELGAGGGTSFVFDRGEVFRWQMQLQGSTARIVDSVLPHEITHTIFASYFRRPLPRWADEGACSTVEHTSERGRLSQLLGEYLATGRGIAFNAMFAMREYPEDVMPLYSQGYSVSRFLLEHAGPQQFVAFLEAGLDSNNWPAAVRQAYGYEDLGQLQASWVTWLRHGSPRSDLAGDLPAVASSEPSPIARRSPAQRLVAMKQGDCHGGQVSRVPMRPPGRVYVHQGANGYVGWQYAGGGQPAQPGTSPPAVAKPADPCPDLEEKIAALVDEKVAAWLAGIKGEKGDKGDAGERGPVGPAVEINLEQLAIEAAQHVELPPGVTKEQMDIAIAAAVAKAIRELPPFEVEIVDGETGQSLGHTVTRLGQKVTFERFRKEVKRK